MFFFPDFGLLIILCCRSRQRLIKARRAACVVFFLFHFFVKSEINENKRKQKTYLRNCRVTESQITMEIVTLDPLDYWPSSIIDCILQHLSGSEILSATKISRGWSKFIENSMVSWKNLVVTIDRSDGFEILVKSRRRYRNIKVVNSAKPEAIRQIVCNPFCKWSTVEIIRTKFHAENDVFMMIRDMAPSVERLNLSLVDFSIPSSDQFSPPHFRKLRDLKLLYQYSPKKVSPWLNRMFTKCPKLVSLNVTNGCDQTIKQLMLDSIELRTLAIAGIFQDLDFFKDLSIRMPSRLEVFEFNDILSSSQSDKNLRHFNDFFKSQSKTLLKFQTDALIEPDELAAAFQMPNLQMLNVKSFHYQREDIQQYLEQQRETQLPASNLKIFHVHLMDQNLLELIALNARNLEELRVDELNASDVSNPSWFPKLQRLQVFWLDNGIHSYIRLKPAQERTHFENKILEGIQMIEIDFQLSNENEDIFEAIED